MERGWTHREAGPAARGLRVLAAGVVLLVLGACSSDSEGSSTLPTAGEPTTTTTVAPGTSTTVPGTATTSPGRKPVYVNGVPQVTATPARGAVGTKVHVDGYGFTDAQWKNAGGTLWLSGNRAGCALYAPAQHSVRVSADGHLSGDFTVPSTGECRQSDTGDAPLGAGTYSIVYQCTACSIGTFEVTGSAAPVTSQCETVGFTPQSEDAASSIVATGLSCDEAESFVRRLGPSVSANGPAEITLDGFRCTLTRHDEEPLPQGFYECNSGSKRITFVRT